ncbi:uncharacterized protein BP5553_01299 [Venustampulla echinocandica]|uniref:CWH43-like N-terminal domain-containing protein n=1 Tax=Venustampulla echinocandica TaxID=2656787 RepID=A0A370U0L5_9HELO|nr:uncharacterized protein BP5553_01299 [Venustampulla echinocandica]RDL41320.1 hypothetical protein BP5553_01299 [Venustampulla echinocandica]
MWRISYWIFPVISSLCWLGTLLGLLIHWSAIGKIIYPSMEPGQTIAYISDVGAGKLKPLFIAGSCVTTIFLDIAFLSGRWLRHRGRLARNTTLYEKVLSCLGILFAVVGTVGLILLKYRQHRVLRISFWIKLTFILVEVALAVAFGVCNRKKEYNAAAVLEWTIAFIFTFYIFTFFIDLAPAVYTKGMVPKFGTGPAETEMQMEQNDEAADISRRTADSQRPLGGNMEGVNGSAQPQQPIVRPQQATNF